MTTYAIVYLGMVLAAMLLVPPVSRFAKKHDLLGEPGSRKVHDTPIPRIGGIAFVIPMLALAVSVFFLDDGLGGAFQEARRELVVLLAAAGFIFAVGLIEDLYFLPGRIKLLALIGASLAICASGATIRSIGLGPWLDLQLGWAGWPLAIAWITLITAGMNFIDELEGLAAGIAVIVCGAVAFVAFVTGQTAMVFLMLALLGGTTGFMFFNVYPAKVLMGNCGSMFLGFMIGAGSLVCQAKTSTAVGLAVPFLILGVPLLDASLTTIRRGIIYGSILGTERGYLHRCLLDTGLPRRTVTLIIYAVTAIAAGLGIFMLSAGEAWGFGLFVAGVVFLLAVFVYLGAERIRETILAFACIRAMLRDRGLDKKRFKDARSRLRKVTSFDVWWEAFCDMSKQMRFQTVELWRRANGRCVKVCTWDSSESVSTGEGTVLLSFSCHGRSTTDWELKAGVSVSGRAEPSGRRALLLARLIEECPPPEPCGEAKALGSAPNEYADLNGEEHENCANVVVKGAWVDENSGGKPEPLDVTGIPVAPFETYDEALKCIENTIESGRKSFWVAINPQKCYRAWREGKLFDVLKKADVGICDGVGVSIASRILNGRYIERITGCDLFFKLMPMAAAKGWRVFMLGASEESNAIACKKLCKMYQGLKIVGSQSGFFEDSRAVIDRINSSNAELLFVAMGSPTQEYWIARHREEINAAFCMGVGGSFDVVSGTIKRAPMIFRKTGTEWLYQLVTEPRKRLKRQTVYVPYMFRVLGKSVFGSAWDTERTSEAAPSRVREAAQTQTG